MFLYGGTSNSDAALSDWFKRINDEGIMIMPNVFNLSNISYVPYTGRIIEMENDDNFTELENILKQYLFPLLEKYKLSFCFIIFSIVIL